MLKWLENYYVGEGIKKPEELQKKINEGKTVPAVFLITLAMGSNNILEIVPALMLTMEHNRRHCPPIIGMAGGKQKAIRLVQTIITEVYEATGAFDVKAYLKNR